MRNSKVIITGLAVLFLATAAYAQTTAEKMPYGDSQKAGQANKGGDKKEGIMKALDLTPEQQQKLKENRQAQRETAERLHKEIREKQEKLRSALKSPDVTKAAVTPLVNEIKSIQDQLIDLRVEGIFTVKSILTPEQFAKFQEMTEKMQEKMKEKMKDRGKGHMQEGRENRNPDAEQGPPPEF